MDGPRRAAALVALGERAWRTPTARALESAGMDVHVSAPALVLERAAALRPAVVLLADDLVACSRLRAAGSTPAVLVVLGRGDERAVIEAFEAGADDVYAGPLRPAELCSRARRLTRESQAQERLWSGSLILDMRARSVTLDGCAVALSPGDYDLLAVLASDPGRLWTRSELISALRLTDRAAAASRALDARVARLRRRLGAHGDRLVSVWGVGFRLMP